MQPESGVAAAAPDARALRHSERFVALLLILKMPAFQITYMMSSVTLRGTDTDGDELTFRIQSLPLNGTVSGTVPNLSYIPKAGFIGNDQLTYIINDGLEDSEPVAVEMMVASEKTTSGSTEASDDSSGGCSTGEGSSGSAWLIVLLVAGLCLQRKGITPQAEESQ